MLDAKPISNLISDYLLQCVRLQSTICKCNWIPYIFDGLLQAGHFVCNSIGVVSMCMEDHESILFDQVGSWVDVVGYVGVDYRRDLDF